LLSTHATVDDLLKPLRTDDTVAEISPGTRSGVIVFDVQEAGRVNDYFRGEELMYGALRELEYDIDVFPDDCHYTCAKFASPQLSNDRSLHDAMTEYFKPWDEWSLSHMAFKYIVRDAAGQCFMQDSFELHKLESTITPATFDACRRCPVCLEVRPESSDMYIHIRTRHQAYPLAALAPAPPQDDVTDITEDLEAAETAAHDSSDSSSNSALSSVQLSQRSAPAEPVENHHLVQEVARIQSVLNQLRFTAPLRPVAQAAVQAASAQHNYDALQKHCHALEAYIDQHANDLHLKVEQLTQTLDAMSTSIQAHLHEQNRLQNEVLALSKQNDENLQQKLQPYIDKEAQSSEENKQLLVQVADLKQEVQDLTKRLADAPPARAPPPHPDAAELERLRAQVAQLIADADGAGTEAHTPVDAMRETNAHLAAHQLSSDALRHAQQKIAALEKDGRQKDATIAQLRKEIAEYKSALDSLRQELERLLREKQLDAKDLKDTVSKGVRTQIDLGKLTEALQRADFAAIRAAAADTGLERTEYSPCALFLILEAMGATWAMYLRISKKPHSASYNAKCTLIVEQMLYDIAIWDSIENSPKPTRYTSHHVSAFIEHFGLYGEKQEIYI
jgi:hypothetical protein